MSYFSASTKHWLAAPLALALALGYSSAQAQVAPTPAPAQKPAPKNVVYYVDGKLATASALEKINPSDIDHLDVRKEAAQRNALGAASADGVVLITTKANAGSPDVVAFNSRFPLTPAPAAQTAAVAAATAYITKNYPSAKLEEVAAVSGQANRYRAIFTAGGQRLLLLFDGQGQPVRQ